MKHDELILIALERQEIDILISYIDDKLPFLDIQRKLVHFIELHKNGITINKKIETEN